MTLKIRMDPSLGDRVRAGRVLIEDLRPADAPESLDQAIEATVSELRAQDEGKSAGQIERLGDARRLYRAFGLDPTRHRPSPEALLRRVLRGDAFPRVHPPVDLANLWAIVHGLPVGLYDVERLEGSEILMRVGDEGEIYEGIRKPEIHLAGRLTLADAAGPFGNPSADSLRTSCHAGTRCCLAVVFATADYPTAGLERWCAWLVERAARLLGAGRAEAELV